MASAGAILALDQGTTSTRSMLFRPPGLQPLAMAQQEIAQHYPAPGWVEHEPEEIWQSALATMRQVIAQAGLEAGDIAAIGIANQRETVLLWERATGRPLHRAIVWQDRRTAPACARLRQEGHGAAVEARTGLLIDPYFSATKLAWLLKEIPGARAAAARGELAFGTVDSWLLWRLTGGRVHATDATNAARTLLFDIHRGQWDAEMLALFGIPEALLPEVRDCAAEFGVTEPSLLGAAIPVRGIAGDQQAATLGQACFTAGMAKVTYGTGAFALLHTGDRPVRSRNRLLTTIACQLGGHRSYALEGAIFVAGAAVQWLRDGLGLIDSAGQSGMLAAGSDPAKRLYLVPAFVGLGVPHWDAEARGAIFGLTRDSGPADFARAALESVAFQTRDLMEAMQRDLQRQDGTPVAEAAVLRVDGGMAASDWTMQALADLLDRPVDRPEVAETTALGAAYLAGLQSGLCPEPAEFARYWQLQRRFTPALPVAEREAAYGGWCEAVRRTLSTPVEARR